jgi:hypothetical protein
MVLRLHRGGKFRSWLGARFGGDFALGDRIWRRVLHAGAALVLVYYLLPVDFFVIAPKEYILVAGLAVVLALEAMRHFAGLELPTIRGYEAERFGSFAAFALAIVVALLVFPEAIACAVVLGTAVADPVAGELRARGRPTAVELAGPFAVYAVLAFAALTVAGPWPVGPSVGLALLAAAVAVAVERPKVWWFDDDVAMTLVPAVALYLVAIVGLGYRG